MMHFLQSKFYNFQKIITTTAKQPQSLTQHDWWKCAAKLEELPETKKRYERMCSK